MPRTTPVPRLSCWPGRNPSPPALIAALALAAGCSGQPGEPTRPGGERRPARPNVLVILTDEQPVSTVAAYGNPRVRTPSIDRIAREGMRLDRFHIAAFACSPSRASFLTGRYAHKHGVVLNDIPLAEEVPTLGTLFRAAGYQTVHIGKWHLGGQMNRAADPGYSAQLVPDRKVFRTTPTGRWRGGDDLPQGGFTDKWVGGWTHYQAYLEEAGLGFAGLGIHNIAPSGPEGTHIYSKVPEEHHMAAFLAGEAESFIRQERDPGRPFCMVLSFYGPHSPVAPPRPWDSLYDAEEVELPANHEDRFAEQPAARRNIGCCYKLPEWTKTQFRDYVARYWGYVSYIDAQIGRVLRALDEGGLTDETIIVFTSDHGDFLASHGSIYKFASGYDELMRVPFAVRYPARVASGTTTEALVSSIDLLPTLLSLAGIERPAEIDGRSFEPVLRRPDRPFREVLFTHTPSTVVARRDDWKLVLNRTGPRPFVELYDMRDKPLEMDNQADAPAARAILQSLKEDVAKWARQTRHPHRKAIVEELESAAVSP